jgi:hypothetical protein
LSPFPNACSVSRSLSPQQKFWEFLLFDTATCVQPG